MPLAFELGDAWRSWCNRNGENNPVAELDLEVFRASLDGYRAGLGRPLSEGERRALLLGLDWVSVELAARFAADALYESYFGWDPSASPAGANTTWSAPAASSPCTRRWRPPAPNAPACWTWTPPEDLPPHEPVPP